MCKAKTIFGSNPEGAAFQSIGLHLPQGWAVYPNLPLSQLVRVGKHELSGDEWELYLKTSVDFTLVEGEGNPSLIVEFDGMGEGFSSSTTYIQFRQTRDPNRKAKLDFKLRLCDGVGLPLLVISFPETAPCTRDGLLSIVNGLFAQHIATKTYQDTIKQWDSEGRGQGQTWDAISWDLARLDGQTQCDFDPFLKRMSDHYERFVAAGVKSRLESLSQPDQLTAMRGGVAFESVGARFTVEGGGLEEPVVTVVWVRNLIGKELFYDLDPCAHVKCGVNPLRIAWNIAQCLGQERVLEVLKKAGKRAQ
jgi:hypothetical protein